MSIKLTHIAVGTAVVLASVTGAVAALSSTAYAAGNGCYDSPPDRVTADERAFYDGSTGARVWASNPVFVTDGSPCRDINVRGSWDSAAGRSACVDYRVRFVDPDKGWAEPWQRVCRGWETLYTDATENDVFVIESKGTPGSVVVRS